MKAKPAFTLIELLTVIAIIGILSAILIPVIASVREQARGAKCQSNLRVLGTAVQLYTLDHNDRFPPLGGSVPDGLPKNWFHALRPYVADDLPASELTLDRTRGETNFFCPSQVTRNGDEIPGNVVHSYGYNQWLSCPYSGFIYLPRAVSRVSDPSRLIMIADGRRGPGKATYDLRIDDNTRSPERVHGGGSSFHAVFADGHVSALSEHPNRFDPFWDAQRLQ